MRPSGTRVRALLLVTWLLVPVPAAAQLLTGDVNGDGAVDAADAALLPAWYGAVPGDPTFEPAADLNGDGRIDFLDLALFGAGFGASGGAVDTTPPTLFVTLNDVPDDMNDLLVVPPERFQVTLGLNSAGGSALDTGSLSVTSDQPVGFHPAGTELAGEFTVTPTRAVWEVPVGSNLPRTSHFLTVSVQDLAGNLASRVYGFAVRDFAARPPLGNLQTVFLDFDQNRSLTPAVDFLEDLREYGLSTAAAPTIEMQMRDRLVAEIVSRAQLFFGRNPDGTPGPDAANVVFQATLPGVPHSRLCVGGQSSLGGSFLGSSTLDVNNLNETSDECALGSVFGVFPQAIDNLWGANAGFQATFNPLDPDAGGTPVGLHPLDATVLAPGFDPAGAPAAQLARWSAIENAVDAFAQIVATAAAHETGHLLGLVAHGPAPGGLWGGSTGGNKDHNVTVGGTTPAPNWLMNSGGSFTFEEMTGRGGLSLPVFRPLNWAYLHDRVVLDASVTGLFPAPTLTGVQPASFSFSGAGSQLVTFQGTHFLATPTIELLTEGDPTPNPVLSVTFVNAQTVTGIVYSFLAPPALYDVRLRNPDGQETILVDGLEVLP